MSRHRNTFVSGRVLCVAVIYGSSYVWDMKGHSSHSSSVCGSRRISMWHWGNTSRWTSLYSMPWRFQHIRLSFSSSKVLASDCINTVFFNVKTCQQFWLKNWYKMWGKSPFYTLKWKGSLCSGFWVQESTDVHVERLTSRQHEFVKK